jgi:hypothetical protein
MYIYCKWSQKVLKGPWFWAEVAVKAWPNLESGNTDIDVADSVAR